MAAYNQTVPTAADDGDGDMSMRAEQSTNRDAIRAADMPPVIRRTLSVVGWLPLVTHPERSPFRPILAGTAIVIAAILPFGVMMTLSTLVMLDGDNAKGAAIAIGVGGSSSWVIVVCATYKMISSPVFRTLLRDAASREAMAKEWLPNVGFVPVWFLITVPLLLKFVFLPALEEGSHLHIIFGADATPALVWATMVLYVPAGTLLLFLTAGGDCFGVPFGLKSKAIIGGYAQALKGIFLDKGLTVEARLARVTAEQARVERWAYRVNDTLSTAFGLHLLFYFSWIVLALAVMFLVDGAEAAVGTFAFAVMCFVFGGRSFFALTLTSRAFRRARREVLNEAHLLPGICACFGDKLFGPWWEAHELAATKMFGVALTTPRIVRALVGVGSAVVVVGGFVLRAQMTNVMI